MNDEAWLIQQINHGLMTKKNMGLNWFGMNKLNLGLRSYVINKKFDQ